MADEHVLHRALRQLRARQPPAQPVDPGHVAPVQLTDAVRFLHLLLSLPVVVDPVARRRAFEGIHRLARTHDLTSYDAAYLEVAVRYGIPVATLDERLRKAVVAEGLSVFEG